MSVSGIPAAPDIDIVEFERRLRASGDQQARRQLAEFVRVIESYETGPVGSTAPEALSRPGGMNPEPTQSPKAAPLQPSTALAADEPMRAASLDVEAPQPFESGDTTLHGANIAGFATKRRSGAWLLKASALALAGAALIGAGFGLKTGALRLTKAPSFIAAPRANAAAQPNHDIAAASIVPDATPLEDLAQPASVKTVASDGRPTVFGAAVLLGNMPGSQDFASASANAAQPATQASPELAAAPVTPPVVASPPSASKVLSSGPVLEASPDAQPSTTASPSATTKGAHSGNQQQPLIKPAKAGREIATVARPPTPKPVPLAKPSKSSARFVVAKAEATGPGAAAEMREPLHGGASIVVPQVSAEPQAPPPSAPEAGQPVASVAHAFGAIVGALVMHGGSDPQPADQTAAKSADWAVQFAAPKSEAQAKVDASRLNAKYAPALNGATIGIHETVVKGETVYALRATGLSKAEAAALCDRVKGRDCSLAK